MAYNPQSKHQHQSIRPSLADLSDVDFFEKLEAEANQLRNSKSSIHHDLNVLPSISSPRQKPEGSKVPIKKSRFSQSRKEELHEPNYLGDGLAVPTGRFQLDLNSETTDDADLLQAKSSDNIGNTPVITEITERYGEALETSNNIFDPKFSSDSFLETSPFNSISSNSSQCATSLRCQPSIPPWELRQLASRNGPQKSRLTSVNENDLTVMQHSSFSDAMPLNSTIKSFSSTEKQQISSENESLLSKMSPQEILQEQATLKAHLMQSNPELLTKLLTKLNIQETKDSPSNTPSPTTRIPKKQKQLRYAEEDEVFPCKPSPLQTEIPPCLSNLDNKPASIAIQDSLEPYPLRFDWNGVRAVDRGDTHASINSPSDDSIHNHQTNSFTFKQLLRLILSSVPAQRVMGLKILNQIIVRHFENSAHDINDMEIALLVQEFNNAAFEILIVTSQAIRDRNLGIATSALVLMNSIFSKARVAQATDSKHKCIVQPAWIEHLLTQTTLLATLHSQFQHRVLPPPSLTCIVQLLCDMIALGESSRVSEEIVKRTSFLELIVQGLIAVPWPMSSKSHLELPDLAAFELLLTIAKSSRACSQSILDRGLLTPMLRFIGVPYWNSMEPSDEARLILNDHVIGVLINCMRFPFDLMAIFARYGLGASLRTTLDPLLRTATIGLQNILKTSLSAVSSISSFVATQQFNLISSYLKLLQIWMRCADDHHSCDPPHSINWSQVTEWESSALEFLRLALIPSPRPQGVNKVLATACDLITLYIVVSFKKKLNITNCLASLNFLIPQLQSVFQTAARTLVQSCHNQKLKPDLSESYLLISLAKLKISLAPISTQTENLATFSSGSLEYDFPDDVFALVCRAAFDHDELSLLPWALSILHLKSQTKSQLEKTLLAGLFVRNSDGMIVREILTETFNKCQSKIQFECQFSKEDIVQAESSPQLSQLLPIFLDYINYSGTSTQILEPSPYQIRNQSSQNDKAAFLLPSTWPLLAITCLKPEHLTSSTNKSRLNNIDIVRSSYALAGVLQSSLNDIQTLFPSLLDVFQRFLSDRYLVWKSVMGSLISTDVQACWSHRQNTNERIWSSIFEDPVCSQLIIHLIKISPLRLRNPPSQLSAKQKSISLKAQESEEAELYAIYTDLLSIYNSTLSDQNHSFMKILTPFLSMSRVKEFRGILFNDHTQVLKNMWQVGLEDVINVDGSCDDATLDKYLYPIEDNAQILHKFAEFLTTSDGLSNLKSIDHSFLVRYLVHHVASQCWNDKLDDNIRIDLIKIILGVRKLDSIHHEISQLILNYDPCITTSARISHLCRGEKKQDVNDDLDPRIKSQRCEWLAKKFSSNKSTSDDNQFYLDRLRDLDWMVSNQQAKNLLLREDVC